jgi:hypothetical protein
MHNTTIQLEALLPLEAQLEVQLEALLPLEAQLEAQLEAPRIGEQHPVVQSSITCTRTLELLDMLLCESNLKNINLTQMFGTGHRYQGMAAIWDYEGQQDTNLMEELVQLLAIDGTAFICWTVLVVDGEGSQSQANECNQPSHKDCHPLMFAVLGQVHSNFWNSRGTRFIGTATGDIRLDPEQKTEIHGRYSHFGKGRTAVQGSHAVLHAFAVVSPLQRSYTDLPAERQEYILKHVPELDEENPATATAWPRCNVLKRCDHCSRRFAHYSCTDCTNLMCYACAPMEQIKCIDCLPKKRAKSKL